jgi:uncharacterized protein (TIGR03083 family)
MNPYEHHTRTAIDSISQILRDSDVATLGRPVAACDDWTVADLVGHLGGVHRWATVAIREQRGDQQTESAPGDPAELADWFATGAADLLEALSGDPHSPTWSFSGEPGHDQLSFWQRRQAHENTMHAWDAATALGAPATYDESLAADGIGEVLEVFVPRMRARGLLGELPASVALIGPDFYWLLGDAPDPIAEAQGTCVDLLLTLWHRTDGSALSWGGHADAGRAVLRQRLVP